MGQSATSTSVGIFCRYSPQLALVGTLEILGLAKHPYYPRSPQWWSPHCRSHRIRCLTSSGLPLGTRRQLARIARMGGRDADLAPYWLQDALQAV